MIRAAFERYARAREHIPRTFDTGIPVVIELPVKHWVCFFLARTLGNWRTRSRPTRWWPCWTSRPRRQRPAGPIRSGLACCSCTTISRLAGAAVAWALGRIGDPRAVPVLLQTIANLDNAVDTRHAAAVRAAELADVRWRTRSATSPRSTRKFPRAASCWTRWLRIDDAARQPGSMGNRVTCRGRAA